MAASYSGVRRFCVHTQHAERRDGHIVEETSFEAAAAAYVEDFNPPPDEDGEVSLVVRDLDDGAEHCFRIDLQTGDAAPCP